MNKDFNENLNNNSNNNSLSPDDLLNVFGNNSNNNISNNSNNLNTTNVNNYNNINSNENFESRFSDFVQISDEETNSNSDYNNTNINNNVYINKLNSNVQELDDETVKANRWYFALMLVICICFAIMLISFLKYLGFEIYVPAIGISSNGNNIRAEYKTKIDSDYQYKDITIKDLNDAKNIIKDNSTNQKFFCNNPKVRKIETNIENKYEILGVNFCEIDYEFASELERVLDNIYKEFPNIRGYLTNITITNTDESYIASFSPAKLFATSSGVTGYPNIYKMEIFLNAQYFLDPNFSEIIVQKSYENWFPRNATKDSILAHEMGHYLSFLALFNNSNGKEIDSMLLVTYDNFSKYKSIIDNSNDCIFSQQMVNEAYENYKSKYHTDISIDDFRMKISMYAMENYDETIAEAFHDYYVNRSNANSASKEIINVLKKYLNK